MEDMKALQVERAETTTILTASKGKQQALRSVAVQYLRADVLGERGAEQGSSYLALPRRSFPSLRITIKYSTAEPVA